MPRKRSLEPEKLKAQFLDLQKKYGQDVFEIAFYIYHVCYLDPIVAPIHDKKYPYYLLMLDCKELPLYRYKFNATGDLVKKNINRERAMTYVYLLDAKLKLQLKNIQIGSKSRILTNWEDITFLIYYTLTGTYFAESQSNISFALLKFLDKGDAMKFSKQDSSDCKWDDENVDWDEGGEEEEWPGELAGIDDKDIDSEGKEKWSGELDEIDYPLPSKYNESISWLNEQFIKDFKFVQKYNFINNYENKERSNIPIRDQIKRKLIERKKSFEEKYNCQKKVLRKNEKPYHNSMLIEKSIAYMYEEFGTIAKVSAKRLIILSNLYCQKSARLFHHI